jgi:hypothetical protein
MKPTPTELALIAATLAQGEDAKQFLAKARELHAACEVELSPPPPEQNLNFEMLPFEHVLKAWMPKLTPAYRKKMFHSFWLLKTAKDLQSTKGNHTSADTEQRTQQDEKTFWNEGMSMGEARLYGDDFEKWHKAKVSSGRATAARAMHQKKAIGNRLKAGKNMEKKKTPHLTRTDASVELDKKSYNDWLAQQNSQE